MAQAGSWERNLTRSVAAQVRRYRQQRGMSAQDLSDRCAELGVPIPRPVLSNLETGRRESVTLAELVVLALALEVPPALLMVPVDVEDKMELLPGREVPSEDALGWLAGQTRLVPVGGGLARAYESAAGVGDLVELYQYHQDLADMVFFTLKEGGYTSQDLRAAAETDEVEVREPSRPGALKAARRILREMGVRLPPLPPGLAAIDPPELPREEVSDRMRHAARRA